LATKVNADEIRRETDGSKVDSEQLNSKVQQLTLSLPDVHIILNKTRSLYEEEVSKSKNASDALKNFASANDKIQDEIKKVS
jgi:UDP-N-acetylmuramate-alanine ligase